MFTNTNNTSRPNFSDRMFGNGAFGGKCGDHFRRKKEFFKRAFSHQFGQDPAINIEENEEAYILYLYAAGRNKEYFNISVQDQVLSISYTEKAADDKTFLYQETALEPFERSFQLNGPVLTDQISAAYIDGVLTIHLPKDPDAKSTEQQIPIA